MISAHSVARINDTTEPEAALYRIERFLCIQENPVCNGLPFFAVSLIRDELSSVLKSASSLGDTNCFWSVEKTYKLEPALAVKCKYINKHLPSSCVVDMFARKDEYVPVS